MAETWYKVQHGRLDPKIECVEVARSSTASVWIGDRRRRITGEYDSFYRTREEADAAIRTVLKRKIAACTARIEYTHEEIARFEAALARKEY